MSDYTVEYRVSFRTREVGPRKADHAEGPGDGNAKNVPATSEPRTVRRKNKKTELTTRGGSVRRPSPAKSARLASQLALGHLVERAIEDGTLDGYADAAERLGVTRARISQVVALTRLAPEIQQRILNRGLPASERCLREILREPSWAKQARGLAAAGRDGSETPANAYPVSLHHDDGSFNRL